jgi:hypothetical protein
MADVAEVNMRTQGILNAQEQFARHRKAKIGQNKRQLSVVRNGKNRNC